MRWLKKIFIPDSDNPVELEGIETWMVRWKVRDHRDCVYGREMAQAFSSESDANQYKKSLISALDLLGNKTDSEFVQVEKL